MQTHSLPANDLKPYYSPEPLGVTEQIGFNVKMAWNKSEVTGTWEAHSQILAENDPDGTGALYIGRMPDSDSPLPENTNVIISCNTYGELAKAKFDLAGYLTGDLNNKIKIEHHFLYYSTDENSVSNKAVQNILEIIDKALKAGKNVYIHDVTGRTRSPLVAALYLAHYKGDDFLQEQLEAMFLQKDADVTVDEDQDTNIEDNNTSYFPSSANNSSESASSDDEDTKRPTDTKMKAEIRATPVIEKAIIYINNELGIRPHADLHNNKKALAKLDEIHQDILKEQHKQRAEIMLSGDEDQSHEEVDDGDDAEADVSDREHENITGIEKHAEIKFAISSTGAITTPLPAKAKAPKLSNSFETITDFLPTEFAKTQIMQLSSFKMICLYRAKLSNSSERAKQLTTLLDTILNSGNDLAWYSVWNSHKSAVYNFINDPHHTKTINERKQLMLDFKAELDALVTRYVPNKTNNYNLFGGKNKWGASQETLKFKSQSSSECSEKVDDEDDSEHSNEKETEKNAKERKSLRKSSQ